MIAGKTIQELLTFYFEKRGITREQVTKQKFQNIKRKLSSLKKWAEQKEQIWNESGGCCVFCGKDPKETSFRTIDHIIPLSRGGAKYDIDNWLPACFSCNQARAKEDHKTPCLFTKELKYFFYVLDKEIRIYKKANSRRK